MRKFAFLIHPLEARDLARKYGPVRYLPERVVEGAFKHLPAMVASKITGVRSAHAQTEGWFVGIALTSRQFLDLPEPFVTRRIIEAGHLAERLGAEILGLGAFTSVVGDAGITVASNLRIPVTTGNSYTVATALQGAREAAHAMGTDWRDASICIVGATGSIGSTCAQIVARECSRLTLVARSEARLEGLAQKILDGTGLAPRISTDLNASLSSADVVIAVSSAADSIIEPGYLKVGAVVCDVARPRDVSRRVVEERDDVLVIEGGVVEVPGDVDFNFNFGFPPRTAMACMAETMILALEGRLENFTLGREISVRQVDEITSLATKHGFRLAGFRSFEKAMTDEQISKIKENARRKRATGVGALSTGTEGS